MDQYYYQRHNSADVHGGGHDRHAQAEAARHRLNTEYLETAHRIIQNSDGSRSVDFFGSAVNTDGAGAKRHKEDKYRQDCTKVMRSDGTYLDTDKDNYVALSKGEMRALGVKESDRGFIVDMSKTIPGHPDQHPYVPVVIGDVRNRKSFAELSVHALKGLGYQHVNGNNGVDGNRFRLVLYPHSGNGWGDSARFAENVPVSRWIRKTKDA
jgi:hypothetical protein